jgi:Caspase domain
MLEVLHWICYTSSYLARPIQRAFSYPSIAMPTATLPTLTSQFLLIGVDFYQPAAWPDHDFKGVNLEGCVKDVTALDEYLQNTLHIPSNQIKKLTSSKPSNGGTEPAETPGIRATTANIKSALEAILKECKNGDQVLVHYSGHGGRAPTLWPKAKGEKAYDESLIPCDIRCGGNLLRDVQLGLLLQQMTKKGLMVTIVLDCCYSGGATRGDDEEEGTPRAFEEFRDLPLDMMKPPSELQIDPKSVINEQEIADMLRQRQLYNHFAACQANEKALEKDHRGVLTDTMLKVLKSAGASLPTNGQLFRQIMSQLKSLPKRTQQNPQFSGNKRRVFLQAEESPDIASIPVTEEQSYGAKYIRLEAGSVMGMVQDAEFLVFPWEATEFTESCAVAKLRVYRVRDFFCYAKEIVESVKSKVEYSDGYQAVQCNYPVNSKIKVRLVGSLAKNEIAKNEVMNSGFATVAEAQDDLVNYTLSSTSDEYTLRDGNHIPIPNVPKFPDLASVLTGAYQLAKYATLKVVQNTKWTADCLSPVQFDLGIENPRK